MKIKIDDTNKIIEYAYVGELDDCIEIEDYYFTNTHIYDYYYENGEITRKINLTQVKHLKRAELKTIRERKQNEDFEFKGHIFQATDKDMRNIETKYNAITMLSRMGQDIAPILENEIDWTLKDNSKLKMKIKEVLELYIAWDNRRTQVFNYCNDVLYKQLEEAQSIEEIEQIKWE